MTQKQVYIWYCKYMGILGNVMCMYSMKRPYKWIKGSQSLMGFDEYFENKIKYSGLKHVFIDLFYDTHSRYYQTYGMGEKYQKAKKRWAYFVKNNVKIKSTLKLGDVLTATDNYFMRYEADKVIVNSDYDGISHMVNVKYLKNNVWYGTKMNICYIETCNGEPFNVDYYIIRKGKTYGFDKE